MLQVRLPIPRCSLCCEHMKGVSCQHQQALWPCGLRVGEEDVFYMLSGWACRWVGDFIQTWSFSLDLGSCLKTKTRSWKHIVHPAQRRFAGFIYLFLFFFSSNHAYAYLDAEITFPLWSFSAAWPCPFNFWLQRTPAYVTKLLTQSM